MPTELAPDESGALRVSDVRGTNQSGMRAHNERLVLSLVRRHRALAKAEIARMTGLSAQTVSVIMRGLEEDGLLLKGDPVRGKVGQPSVPMTLDPDGALFFGLKVGRRSTGLILVDFLGRIVARRQAIHRYPTPEGTLDFVTDAIDDLSQALTARQRANIAGLGISIPGFLWEWATIIGEPEEKMAAWRDRDIRADIAGQVGFPVYLQNDATCACGAELVFGPPDYPAEFLHIYVGYFIGGGLVIGNSLFTGPAGNAGALGPLPVPGPEGRLVQLIDVASLAGLETRIAAAGGDPDAIWAEPLAWTVAPDILADWTAGAAAGIACAIQTATAILDFPLVIIDGWLPADLRRDLVAEVGAALDRLDLAGLTRPELRQGTMGPDARPMGAASLPLSQRYLVDG